MGKLIAKMPHADVVSIKLMAQAGVEPTHFFVQMSDNSINVYSLAKLKIVTTIYPPPQAQEIMDVFYVGAPLDQIALLTSTNELCFYSYRHQQNAILERMISAKQITDSNGTRLQQSIYCVALTSKHVPIYDQE